MKRAEHSLSIPKLPVIDEAESVASSDHHDPFTTKRDRLERMFAMSTYATLGINFLAAVGCASYGVVAGPVALAVLNAGFCVLGWIGVRREREKAIRVYFYSTLAFAIVYSVLFSHMYTLHKVKSEAHGSLEDGYVLFKYSVAGLRAAMLCFGVLSGVQLPGMFLAVSLAKLHATRDQTEGVRSVAAR